MGLVTKSIHHRIVVSVVRCLPACASFSLAVSRSRGVVVERLLRCMCVEAHGEEQFRSLSEEEGEPVASVVLACSGASIQREEKAGVGTAQTRRAEREW